MKNEGDTAAPQRKDDVELSFLGLRIRGTVRSIISIVNSTIVILGLVAAMLWHDSKSEAATLEIRNAIWFQTLTLATPQEDRPRLLRNAPQVPDTVKNKLKGGTP